jgi:hypothetical protein
MRFRHDAIDTIGANLNTGPDTVLGHAVHQRVFSYAFIHP